MSDCIFCKIIAGQIPSKKLCEDDEMLAFFDINPATPVHFLVIPKKHISSLLDTEAEDSALLGRLLFKAQELAKQQGCEEKGGRFIINAKSDGGQTVEHLHIHFLGGAALSPKLLPASSLVASTLAASSLGTSKNRGGNGD